MSSFVTDSLGEEVVDFSESHEGIVRNKRESFKIYISDPMTRRETITAPKTRIRDKVHIQPKSSVNDKVKPKTEWEKKETLL